MEAYAAPVARSGFYADCDSGGDEEHHEHGDRRVGKAETEVGDSDERYAELEDE